MPRGALSKTSRITLRIVLAALALTIGRAEAAVDVVTISEAPIPVNYTDREIQIQQFDPSLGRLESVSIEVQATGTFTQLFEHLGHSDGNLVILQRLRLTLDTAADRRLIGLTEVENHRYSFSGFDGSLDFGGTSGGTHTYDVTASGERHLSSPADLMQFTGSGFVDLFLNATGDLRGHLPRGDCTFVGELLTAGANIIVRYDYVAVPEASTWMAGGVAVLGLAITTRSRGSSFRRRSSRGPGP